MINELFGLTEALDQAGIKTESIHPQYKPIPRVTKKAPCVHIILDHGKVYKVESLEQKQAAGIKKYGSNQGTFPAMNLAPLYRLTDDAEKKMVSELLDENFSKLNIDEIHRLCHEDNWGKKFCKKYRICMQDVPQEISTLFQTTATVFPPLQQLIEKAGAFKEAAYLHAELERAAFSMLEQGKGIVFALQILFHLGKPEQKAEEDGGTLSAVLDSRSLIRERTSSAAAEFTREMNRKLIEADAAAGKETTDEAADAFGQLFEPLEKPMPTVKLAAGFDVTLRTMFRGQPCQTRYGRIENATYPISGEMRFKLQSALAWMSTAEYKGITWISTDKDEALFAYPETLRKNMYSSVNFLRPQRTEDPAEKDAKETSRNTEDFEAAAKAFICELRKTKKPDTDPMSERIQYFILRKIDRARTKVVYTYNTSPAEIEHCSEQWSRGCRDLPEFLFRQPATLFPLEVSDILNLVWRQDGTPSTDKFKPVPRYHGLQLLFGEEMPSIRRDLYILMNNVTNLAPYLGKAGIARGHFDVVSGMMMSQTKKALALMGLLLYQLEIRKEKYMKEFPYLFGQLLKVSDGLHEMYCKVVRNNDVPNTLAGSGLYVAGAEQPYKTLAVLGQRMNPYITWAKSYRTKDIQIKGEESWLAGWYLSLYENISSQIYAVWGGQTRFNEEERAQYFIGYLAKFPTIKKDENNDGGKKE